MIELFLSCSTGRQSIFCSIRSFNPLLNNIKKEIRSPPPIFVGKHMKYEKKTLEANFQIKTPILKGCIFNHTRGEAEQSSAGYIDLIKLTN